MIIVQCAPVHFSLPLISPSPPLCYKLLTSDYCVFSKNIEPNNQYTHSYIFTHNKHLSIILFILLSWRALVGVFWYPSSCRPQEDGPWMVFNLWEVGKRLLGTNRPASACLNGDNFVNISAVVEFYQTENLIWRGCVSIENNTTLIL